LIISTPVSSFSHRKPLLVSTLPGTDRPTGISTTLCASKEGYKKKDGGGGADLYRVLDDTFSYEGRLPSTGDKSSVASKEEEDPLPEEEFRCGFVGIVGAPNMGKSTLMNALLQTELCAATPKPQTTRHAIMGVLTIENRQICFTDTPGVIGEPAYKLQEGMMEAVKGAFKDSDAILVVTDLFSTPISDDRLFSNLQKCGKPTIVVVNKVDLAEKVSRESDVNEKEGRTVTVPEAVSRWRDLLPDALAIIPACASVGLDDPGVSLVLKLLTADPNIPAAFRELGRPVPGMFRPDVRTIAPEEARDILPISPPLYDKDTLTDRTERFFASELIRAALFGELGKELPYCCDVRVTEFKDSEDIIRMKATIFVERDSQKGIVIGKGGQKVKDVGIDARKRLVDFFQTKVYLDLSVKVDKDWRKDEAKLKAYGYLKK